LESLPSPSSSFRLANISWCQIYRPISVCASPPPPENTGWYNFMQEEVKTLLQNGEVSLTKCNSCLLYERCSKDLKGHTICDEYKTKIVSERDESEKLVRFHCVPNDKRSDWHKPWECNDPPENLQKIAEQLEARPKDIFAVIINDSFIASSKRPAEVITLEHLNLIENPDLAGKAVIVDAVVSSTSMAYLVPSEIEGHWEGKDGVFDVEVSIDEKDPRNLEFVGCNVDVKHKRLKRAFGEGKNIKILEKSWRTVYRVRVRPPVFTLEKHGEKIVDEKGFEYKAYDIFVTSDKAITFQPSSVIRLEGICTPNPRTQKTTLLVYKVEFPEETGSFNIEPLKALKQAFEGKTVKERLDWILTNFEDYSQIVGRRNLARVSLLCFFTPVWARFNNEIQKGWGNTEIIGDTTTGKSETLRKMIRLLKAGMLITAETASAVGLTGATIQLEGGGWFVDWGFLVLCDRKLLAIDGAHKLPFSQWAALAEAERSGVVMIVKAGKNSAYARTRQIKICNAIDRQADKFATKSLRNFLYPCQSLGTTLDKTSMARLDLAAFADSEDVKAEEINKTFDGTYDKRLDLLSEALRWCWSEKVKVIFTEKATKKLLNAATKLHQTFFCESIPVVSIDMKWKLARASTALAFLTLSTENFEELIVTEAHVEEVVRSIKDEYVRVGLNTLAQETRFEVLTIEDVDFIINRIVEATKNALDQETVEKIFKFIVLHGRVTRDEIKTNFSISENKQLRPLLAILSSEKLTKTSKGVYSTPKLIQAHKLILERLSRLTSLTRAGKGPPQKPEKEENKIMGGPSAEVVNLVKLDDLKSVHWANKFYDQHPCCICGYTKLTSWQTETFKGQKLWICEDCKLEWEGHQEVQ